MLNGIPVHKNSSVVKANYGNENVPELGETISLEEECWRNRGLDTTKSKFPGHETQLRLLVERPSLLLPAFRYLVHAARSSNLIKASRGVGLTAAAVVYRHTMRYDRPGHDLYVAVLASCAIASGFRPFRLGSFSFG